MDQAMTLPHLHAKRWQILNDIRRAELARRYDVAARLLVEFQEVNELVRNVEEAENEPS